ncbi:PilZN3 domain-containing protein [Spirochaeta cellobiosiphila]|uniref:PilZN3 domain-containing protein n=1 Tax=Spirochaeta cellobiosiphila TaxID=504483 RepID=UPI0003F9FCA4|nr:PilZN3 domain-containing protein [Spirochaeta cellobiosiphila]
MRIPSNQYLNEFGTTEFKLNSYSIDKLGIANTQAYLKIKDYHINTVPYLFSLKKITLLAVLNVNEVSLFQKYIDSLATLTMSFILPNKSGYDNVLIRSKIISISAMENRENVCIFVLEIPSPPDQMVKAVGDHLCHIQELNDCFKTYHNKYIPLTKESIQKLGYNNYAEIKHGENPILFRITHLGVNRLKANIPRSIEEIKEFGDISGKLFFRKYRIELSMTLGDTKSLGSKLTTCTYYFKKHLPYLEILEDYLLSNDEELQIEPNLSQEEVPQESQPELGGE